MSYLASSTSSLQSIERIGQGAISGESQRESSPHSTPSIHVLDDDTLLNVFHLFLPFLSDEDQDDDSHFWGCEQRFANEYWWYKLSHVCQRWRHLILGSSSYLGISLVCTYGTPVADMLAHSPPLPLVIDYFRDLTAEDEEGLILALKQRDRVSRLRLRMPLIYLQKLFVAIDEEYPILEYLVIWTWMGANDTIPIFPEAFRAPHLRHLALRGCPLPIGPVTAVGLVTLALFMGHRLPPSFQIHLGTLLQSLSFMSQLETLMISFHSSPCDDLKRKMMYMPIMTLPNLHSFKFRGESFYLETLGSRITTPRLDNLQISYPSSATLSIPHLLKLINTTENVSLSFDGAEFNFSTLRVHTKVDPHEEAKMNALSIDIYCWDLERVSSMTRVSNALGQVFPAVEYLTLDYDVQARRWSREVHVQTIEWRQILKSFSNVKTLRVDDMLVERLSRCLRSDDGESPLDLLPELHELTYSGSGSAGDLFSSFVDARQSAGRPVTLIRRNPSPDPSVSVIH